MQGTLDDTAFITAPTAMQFMDMMGGPQAIFTYNHGLLGQVCAHCACERYCTTS